MSDTYRKMALRLLTLWLWSTLAQADLKNQLNVPESAFTSWFLPTVESGPCDVSLGPDNFLYVQGFFTDKIAKFDQYTGKFVAEYDIPFTVPPLSNFTLPIPSYAKFELLACAIRTGYDGAMYFSNGAHNQLVRHNVTSGETTVFTPPGLLQPLGNLQPFNDITTAPDGVYFSQTTGNLITHFNYHTHSFKSYTLPTPLAIPLGMYYAADGGIWVLEFAANKVARFDRKKKTFKEYNLPLNASQPLVVRAETRNSDGSTTLWIACTTSSSIAGINTRSGKIVNYVEPNAPTLTVEVAQDQKGNVWATHILQNSLGVLNPKTGNVSVVVEPSVIADAPVISVPFYGETGVFGYGVGQPPGKGNRSAAGNAIYYTHFLSNQLVRLDLSKFVVP